MSYEEMNDGRATTTEHATPLLDQVLANTQNQPLSMGAESLQAAIKAEIDVQISTAKAYPRNIHTFRQTALALATLDERVAGDCFYRLPRGGKNLEGPSIRMAEIVASAWGNLRTVARIVSIDKERLVAQATTHDLETNTAVTLEVHRRITDKSGRRFSEDMIAVTANAATSIAIRNSIFRVVPFAHVKPIIDQAKAVSLGKGKSFAEQRDAALKHWRGQGVTDDRLCAALMISGVEDIALDDLLTLRGWYTAIKDGDTTLEECFPAAPNGKAKGKGAAGLAETLAAKKTATEQEPATAS
jgi:hypothetical protein